MAELGMQVLGITNNDNSLEIIHAFERVFVYVTDEASDRVIKRNCLQSIGTLIHLEYEAVKELGMGIHLEIYQKHFQSYLYHSSIYFGEPVSSPKGEVDDHAFQMAQNLAHMLLLGVDCFEQLDYPSYYKDFEQAVQVVFESVGLSQEVAKLLRVK